ncbi:hypothetical protein PF008_g10737 [Phytophthora fragariae]|uniref:OTU domain-containing protein n=1 Tax=Phytophthora fragariae TaxID=53985 RepID=A0A6G0RSZ2_9STRA|nr:hypothetical protein PF008_g10737 [Phytophthora fragariae]
MTAPPASGRLSSRFSLRSSAKTSRSLRSWFSSSPKPNGGDDVAEDAAAAARELDATKPRAESSSSYVPRVEYGPPRCDVQERDASWTSNEQVEAHYAALGRAVVPICKDGNCLFRALFKPFIEDEDVADYCARLREDGQWGGHLELYAAAKLFNIHIVVHTGPVRRLRVTNEDDGDAEKQQPPYRTLHLLFKDDHYSSLHSNEEVTTVTPEEDAVVSSDKRPRSPTKVYDSPDKKSGKYQVALTKAVKFQEVVEAKSPQREGHTCIYAEENVPECGVFLPKQVLFRRGKRRVSGATLFSLVHVPSTSNLLPVMESPSTSESSSSSTASTTSETSSSSEEQEERSDTKPPVPPRPKATAPTLRAVPVEYPSKAVFRKGRTTAAAC